VSLARKDRRYIGVHRDPFAPGSLIALMMEAARTYETSVENYFTRQYNPEDNSELHIAGLLYMP
jgi:hypothetical protein